MIYWVHRLRELISFFVIFPIREFLSYLQSCEVFISSFLYLYYKNKYCFTHTTILPLFVLPVDPASKMSRVVSSIKYQGTYPYEP